MIKNIPKSRQTKAHKDCSVVEEHDFRADSVFLWEINQQNLNLLKIQSR